MLVQGHHVRRPLSELPFTIRELNSPCRGSAAIQGRMRRMAPGWLHAPCRRLRDVPAVDLDAPPFRSAPAPPARPRPTSEIVHSRVAQQLRFAH